MHQAADDTKRAAAKRLPENHAEQIRGASWPSVPSGVAARTGSGQALAAWPRLQHYLDYDDMRCVGVDGLCRVVQDTANLVIKDMRAEIDDEEDSRPVVHAMLSLLSLLSG